MLRIRSLVLLVLTIAAGLRLAAAGPVPTPFVATDGGIHFPVETEWAQLSRSDLLARAKAVYQAIRARGVSVPRLVIVMRVTGEDIGNYAESELQKP
jgi:hypothetical protein